MPLPHFAVGRIIKGFQRGSGMGFPTANYELSVIKALPDDFKTGIYCGWASVDNGEVHKMVMSVGWNPFYHNKEKSMETHILHKFEDQNLYGRTLKVCITTYLRDEIGFTTIENLIEAISLDIERSKFILEEQHVLRFKEHNFFSQSINGH